MICRPTTKSVPIVAPPTMPLTLIKRPLGKVWRSKREGTFLLPKGNILIPRSRRRPLITSETWTCRRSRRLNMVLEILSSREVTSGTTILLSLLRNRWIGTSILSSRMVKLITITLAICNIEGCEVQLIISTTWCWSVTHMSKVTGLLISKAALENHPWLTCLAVKTLRFWKTAKSNWKSIKSTLNKSHRPKKCSIQKK